MLLQQETGVDGCTYVDAEEEFTDAVESFAEPVPAVSLLVTCARHGGSGAAPHCSAPGWSLRVQMRAEPFRFLLAPWSVRRAVDVVIAVAQSCERVQSTVSLVPELPDELEPAADGGGVDSPTSGDGSSKEAADIVLDLDLDVAAPVLRR